MSRTEESLNDRIFGFSKVPETEKARLFCFSYAGGSASFYSDWSSFLHKNIGVYPYELAGHGGRAEESTLHTVESASKEAADTIKEFSDKPILLYGHSMGGIIAFQTSFELAEKYGTAAAGLFISASVPNYSQTSKMNGIKMSELNDEEFCDKLIEFEAIDKRIFRVKSFKEIYLPVIRSDFYMTENFIPTDNIKLDSDMFIYGGSGDKIISAQLLNEWKVHTNKKIQINVMSGGHFFVRQHKERICSDISNFVLRMEEI